MANRTRVLESILRPICWVIGHHKYPVLWPMGWLCVRCHKRRSWMTISLMALLDAEGKSDG